MTLDDIDITNLLWTDQYLWSSVQQESERSLTGGLIVQEGAKQYGQPITLTNSWLPKSAIEALKLKEAQPALEMALTLDDGTTHAVIFNRSQGAGVEARPVFPSTNAPSDWQYETTIRLLTIEPAQP
ncbi:hypothetical protein BGP77_11420 [Saccharospirillum sp. MSK14-1]|uniref:hypothetical protein n=1 Tax=Saccharospirillum sp. MSK14-1 TaxID=1897632 RepID=UPI000D38AB0F|nr:hypothetical protein [Saccharospirillum sp. MSK14-1]PTY38550.1 hypothetical protein BGP77_11420 [Saccharospirillum sp. MSK14-1]